MLKDLKPWLVSFVFYVAAIVGLNLLLVFIYGAVVGLSGGKEIFEAPFYFRTLSNVLFLEGALVFTVGAFLEFFVKARSPSISRTMMMPYEVLSKRFALEEKDRDAALSDDDDSSSWTLIAIGAAVVILSAGFALISMK